MRRLGPKQFAGFSALAAALLVGLLWGGFHQAEAGGPLITGGTFGVDGQPFTWSTATEIQYRTDGGPLGTLSNTAANSRVQGMFQVWENVATATIGYNRAGQLLPTGAFSGGDVDTMEEFDAVDGSCFSGLQNPIVYADDTLFLALGIDSGVIGFAGPCALSPSGRIVGASAALNGSFVNQLTPSAFDGVFIHEFGHFSGLDHSQINLNCLTGPGCASFSLDTFGLPTMFPILLNNLFESGATHPNATLATDDIAWISRLYPTSSFFSSFGTITGTIFFSDGVTPAQGVNVIARRVGDPRRTAASVVSGYLFTANFGQSITGTNTGGSSSGSRNTSLIGTYEIPGLPSGSYTVEVESINPAFDAGSSVGPLDPPIPSPGPFEFFDFGESATDPPTDSSQLTVSAGGTVSNINIILNGTPPGLDALEPNDTVGTAATIFSGTTSGLSISPFGNEDFYSFGAQVGSTVTVEITAQRAPVSSPLDSVIEIINASGSRPTTCRNEGTDDGVTGAIDLTPNAFDDVCLNDDISLGVVLDSKLEFQPPSTGTFFVHVLDFRGDGRADFQYELVLSGATGGNPTPTLNSISPSSTPVGGLGFVLTVNGTGFINSSVVRWNGTDRTTTFVSSTQLQVAIPASDLVNAGTAQVTVFNPAPVGGTSNSRTFTILSPALTGLVPDVIPATSPGFTLMVNGRNFHSSSVVRWNGANRTTTFVSSTQLQAAIPATDVAAVGTAQITVLNSAGIGGTSNALSFIIDFRNPLPTTRALSPSGAVVGGGAFTLTMTGSNFVFNSMVQWNGVNRPTTFVSKTQLLASIPSTDIMTVGTATVTVSSPTPGGGFSNPLTFTINTGNPIPTILTISPDNDTAGARTSLTLTVNSTATDFTAASVVRFNGTDRPTAFVSSSQLQATLAAADLALAGTAPVTVVTPGPGGGPSNAATFTINNPAPTLAALFPTDAPAGGAAFTLTVNGAGFVPGSVVRWDASDRPTTFVSSTELQAAIPATDIAAASTPAVTVFNPTPGGGSSSALMFTVNAAGNPLPAITSLSPTSAPAGRAGFTLTVDGTGFTFDSVVCWSTGGMPIAPCLSGSPRTTTFVNATQVQAWILATDVATGGTPAVTVFNPTPGGGTSAPSSFTVNNPVPTAAGLSPIAVMAGGGDFTLTVTGSNFVPDSVVRVDGSDRATTFVNKSQLQATILAADIAAPGMKTITAFNPAPSGGTSSALMLTISSMANPVPTIASLSPSTTTAGGAAFTLTVDGSNFVAGAVVRWNGVNRPTTFVSAIQLTASISAEDIARAGTADVTVINPPLGGGTSSPATFTISP